MNFFQNTLQSVEVGKGNIFAQIIPFLTALLVVAGAYDFMIYRGLNEAQSMDNAQLARQIVRGQGFTTEFLRPQAVAQLRDYAATQSVLLSKSHDLFPSDRFPPGSPRILPDTYNAPGYPCLLAAWFECTHPEFDELPLSMVAARMYSPDRWIPILNQIFMILTAVLVFTLGIRLFDQRVAWLSMLCFLGCDTVWHFTLTALSTSFLMFLITAMLMCVLEIFRVGEAAFESENRSFGPAWNWGFAVALLLAAACLTRLHLVVLLVPLVVFLVIMPRGSFALFLVIALLVIGFITPWFLHVNAVSGNPLGSNFAYLLYGEGDYTGNQIFCTTSIPSYQQLFKDATKKEISGFLWHFDHFWTLLGTNPVVLLFVASILHQFKRRRTRLFHWLIFSCAIAIITANNLGVPNPETIGPWNTVVILLPCMLVLGSAFFYILLDRLNVQIRLLSNVIVIAIVALTLAPMIITITTDSNQYNNFPPYWSPSIKAFGQFAQPDEWVTTDMPWATAWYADRASLWLPDSVADFENFHDNTCPSGILLLTSVSLSEPLSNFKSGEYKDWFSFVTDQPAPTTFPLQAHFSTTPGGPDYSVWSDRPRWQER